MNIEQTIKQLKDLLVKGNKEQKVIDQILAQIPTNSKKYNTLLQLKLQHVKQKQDLISGMLTQEEANVGLSRFINALLSFIDNLKAEDFQETTKKTTIDERIGKVCFRIPDIMQINKRNECRIWISFDKETILKEIQIQAGDELKQIRVSDAMGVELIDDSDEDAFKIKTYEEQVQPIEADLLTEWIFKVTPLKVGTFPLVLRITVVVERNGKEMKKSIVLEESINIVTKLSQNAAAKSISTKAVKNFSVLALYLPKSTGEGTGGGDINGGSKDYMSMLGKVLIGITVLAGLFLLLPKGNAPMEETPTADCVQDNQWEQIQQSGNIISLETYLKNCPNGSHISEAQRLIDSLNQLADSLETTENQEDTSATNPEDSPLPTPIENTTSTPERPTISNPIITPTTTPSPTRQEEEEDNEVIIALNQVAHHPILPDCEDSQKTPQEWEACTQKAISDLVTTHMKRANIPQKGNATITFVIDKKGNISNENILKDSTNNRKLAGIVLKVLKELPAFKPGRDAKGRLVRVQYTLPVRYR